MVQERRLLFISTIFFLLNLLPVTNLARTLNQSVGRVGSAVVTSREVQLCHLVTSILNRDVAKENSRIEVLPEGSSQMAEATSDCLVDRILEIEAGALSYSMQGGKDLLVVLDLAKSEISKSAAWGAFALTENDLKNTIRQKIVANEFLESKMRSFTGDLSDREMRAYFESHRAEYANVEFSEAAESIRQKVLAESKERKLAEWFALLHSKHKVRNFLSDQEWKKSLKK